MATIQGFGNVSDVLSSGGIQNLILSLNAVDYERVITNIDLSYGYTTGVVLTDLFVQARLLIVQGKFNDKTVDISCMVTTLPAGVPVPVYDRIVSERNTEISFGPHGFSLSPKTDYAIIATLPRDSASAYPFAEDWNAYLNVTGFDFQKDNPFKELR